MNSARKLPAFFYHILIFLFLFIPYVRVGGVVLHLPYFYSALFAVIFFGFFSCKGVAREYLYVASLVVVPYLWVLWVSIASGVFDLDMQINYLNAFLAMFGSFGLSLLIARRFYAGSAMFLVKSIYFSGIAHAVIMIVAFFFSPVRELLYSFVILGDTGLEFVENLYRAPGLTTGGGDALSIVQASALVLGIYYLVTLKDGLSLFALALHMTFLFILVVSVLLSARTGMVIVVLGMFILAWMHLSSMVREGSISRATLVKVGLFLAVFSFSVPGMYLWVMSSEYSRLATRAFELYLNWAEYGQLGTSSTEQLRTMYFLPDTEKQLIFGTGNFGRDSSLGIISSDVGYVRVWFGSGLLGVMLFYMPIVLILVYFARRAARVSLLFPLMFMAFVLLLVNVKVYHLYGAHVGLKLLLLMVGTLIGMRGVLPVRSAMVGLQSGFR